MKAKKHVGPALGLGIATLLLVGVTGCASTGGKPTTRIYEEKKYIRLHHVQDTSLAEHAETGEAIGMVCSKCKTVRSDALTTSWRHFGYPGWVRPTYAGYWVWEQQQRAYEAWARRHYCPGCKSTISVTGRGKDRKETVKHTCANCGDTSLVCCATRMDSPPTEGMVKQ